MKDVALTKSNRNTSAAVETRWCYSALEHPLSTVTRLLHEQIDVSNQLEGLADRLPHDIDQPRCALLSQRVPVLVDMNWKINEDVIFPALLRSSSGAVTAFTHQTAARLRDERLTDQGYALEVSELLACLADDNCTHVLDQEFNAVGYMLRSFFETTRRAASFELEFIVPAAHVHLGVADLAALEQLLESHRPFLPDVGRSLN